MASRQRDPSSLKGVHRKRGSQPHSTTSPTPSQRPWPPQPHSREASHSPQSSSILPPYQPASGAGRHPSDWRDPSDSRGTIMRPQPTYPHDPRSVGYPTEFGQHQHHDPSQSHSLPYLRQLDTSPQSYHTSPRMQSRTPSIPSPRSSHHVSPPPISPYIPQTARSGTGSAAMEDNSSVRAVRERMRVNAEGKLSVGIDLGTTFTGVAYGSTRMFDGQIRQILNWPGSYETYRKIPTCIVYAQYSPSEEARIVAWGLEAKTTAIVPGLIKCEWFKLMLSAEALRSGVPDPRLPPLPHGKDVVSVIADFLNCLWKYSKTQITEQTGSVADLDTADVLLTVPAAWSEQGCALMREAALQAGLVQRSRVTDLNWRDRLRIITEPEAAAIHASTLSALHNLQPHQSFIICDAGGGTVDTSIYKLLGDLDKLEIAEMCVRSGSNSGSLFVDLKFEELVRRLLKNHPIHTDQCSIAAFLHAFSETDKLGYRGDAEDDAGCYRESTAAMFRFNLFNSEDSNDPSVPLENGELLIPGHVIKTEVFDPIIAQVLSLISHQMSKAPDVPVSAIILVGGFAASEYLFTRVQETFGHEIPVIARPNDCDVATLQGAARYGLGLKSGRTQVSAVISPRAYIMKVTLPADDIDLQERPHFVKFNNFGMQVCENRSSYLVDKGAVLRKGHRLLSRFCKFTTGPFDHTSTAILYVSDDEQIYRYTDEGATHELLSWTVDLSPLPQFQRIAATGGGYVEFDLGLELDSAEVRGVLMSDGKECGRAVFDFIGEN